jgi:uncharacterized protein (TIGR02246 family)
VTRTRHLFIIITKKGSKTIMTTLAHDTASADVAAIHAVLDALAGAWNRGDGAAFGACFTPDADYIDVTGTHTVGGPAIGRLHQFLFDGPLRGSRLEESGTTIAATVDFLAPDVALVIRGGATRLQGQATAPDDRQSINTTVLVKRAAAWQIRAFQNNRILPRPAGPPAVGGPA